MYRLDIRISTWNNMLIQNYVCLVRNNIIAELGQDFVNRKNFGTEITEPV